MQTSSAIHLPEPSQSAFTLPRQGRRNAVLAAVGLPLFVAAHLILEFVFHL